MSGQDLPKDVSKIRFVSRVRKWLVHFQSDPLDTNDKNQASKLEEYQCLNRRMNPSPYTNIITEAEVHNHSTMDDAWMIIHGKVYNVTNLIKKHPGGAECLFCCVGLDGTKSFDDVNHSEEAWKMLRPNLVGVIEGTDKDRDSLSNNSGDIEKTTDIKPMLDITGNETVEKTWEKNLGIFICLSTNIITIIGLGSLILFIYLQTQKWVE